MILYKVRKSILKATFILILANKKVYLKNRVFLSLSLIKKETITILKFWSLLLSIFYIQTLVFYIWKSSFLYNLVTLY